MRARSHKQARSSTKATSPKKMKWRQEARSDKPKEEDPNRQTAPTPPGLDEADPEGSGKAE